MLFTCIVIFSLRYDCVRQVRIHAIKKGKGSDVNLIGLTQLFFSFFFSVRRLSSQLVNTNISGCQILTAEPLLTNSNFKKGQDPHDHPLDLSLLCRFSCDSRFRCSGLGLFLLLFISRTLYITFI